jgi:hypothetical protein
MGQAISADGMKPRQGRSECISNGCRVNLAFRELVCGDSRQARIPGEPVREVVARLTRHGHGWDGDAKVRQRLGHDGSESALFVELIRYVAAAREAKDPSIVDHERVIVPPRSDWLYNVRRDLGELRLDSTGRLRNGKLAVRIPWVL